MIAPRKKLWSTPVEALIAALQLLQIDNGDTVYDIGCGDGNFLALAADRTRSLSINFKGVEIDSERATEAESRIRACCEPPSSVTVISANALDLDYTDGTCFFMYLIPRGLRLILPMLAKISRRIKVVTFMNPLPGISPTKVEKVSSASHAESQWPVFYYEIPDPSQLSC